MDEKRNSTNRSNITPRPFTCQYARFRPKALPSPNIPLAARSVGHHQVDAGWKDESFEIAHVIFLWSIAGSGKVEFDQHFEAIPENHITFLLPGMMQRIQASDNEDWEYCWWSMDGPAAEMLTAGFGFKEPGVLKAGPAPLDQIFTLDKEIRRPGRVGEMQASATAYRLLATAAEARRRSGSPQLDPLLIEVEELIEKHWSDPDFGIDFIAAEAGIHRSTLSRRFHAANGSTLITHLTAVRLQHAMNLLKTTSASVTEVAVACGIRDACYFNRVFKKQIGKTPGEFRKGPA